MALAKREKTLVLACYSIGCTACHSTGLVAFVQEGRTYPNAPCPCCRYLALKKWLDRWCMNREIAPFLWNHFKPMASKTHGRIARQFHRRTKVKQPNTALESEGIKGTI